MHHKAQRTLHQLDEIIEEAIRMRLPRLHISSLQVFRTEIIELGYELDESDFDTWLSNHKGLLDDDYNE